jgi:GNAT superfamily N-acetyltransferase
MAVRDIDLPIRAFDPANATEAEWAALNRFYNALQAETDPDDEPQSLAQTQGWILHSEPTTHRKFWVVPAPDGSEIVASGRVETWDTEDNRHMAHFYIEVRPAYRRRGLARRLLAPIAQEVRDRGRRLLTTWTVERIPAGAGFLARLGAKLGQEGHMNQLRLADVDRAMLERWQTQARERAAGFEIGLWDGRYPEDQLEAIAELHHSTNLAPRGDLDEEDVIMTPQRLREGDDANEQQGYSRWSIYAREIATGKLAGFTELYWHPDQPTLAWQGWTAVWPQYRNKGLGRWIKAAMIEKLLAERPQVTRVRTENADSNGPMLQINYDLGFRPYQASHVWQVPLDTVEQYHTARQQAAGRIS